ncbi:deoxyribonuclease V [Thermoflexus sp.]|uniref:deoxyribonuclease V n=1 Tax=Thermoflexus sp. TaxID=1969742 RepID=UPI0025DBEBB7|nr:deoxyribonuclease V [Thermoflexus sp.]MDW8181335.1 deoxyribonuclease V [Anaerolineae bacterium]MCS6963092.1 deoxyribonuclease V [Thermoflexus sp.]MCS7351876.1 deoxyribonuclease V [Thermoflexus sp.]MCX7690105.1 deoxyribonuclease V [Thermoflexus sp.]MDW8185756.1 deoxyribonuclease V [Anaerolineae bacterium]
MPIQARHVHPWDVSPEEAVAIQQQLRSLVIREGPMPGPGAIIVGVDVGFRGDFARAAAVAVRFPELTPLAQAVAEVPAMFPYIPGLLAFREAPAILAALNRLEVEPHLLMVDGHGISHPRRMGIATHLGVYLDLPSIGCAKSKLWGRYEMPPDEPGAWTPLRDGEEIIGAVLRTQAGISPLFVSIGHRISLENAIATVMACVRGHRLPEPTRLAHRAAGGADVVSSGRQSRLL